jgi:ATP:cob(I)alamin adenosyltransferase
MALAAGSESSSFGKEQIEWLDITNEDLSRQIKKPGQFIFNFHKSSSAFINVARAVTRRVERSAVHLAQNNALARSDIALPYLNRLSTLLFSLMIFEEQGK